MVVAGSPITVTGGHCWFMGGEADSEDDLRRMVRTHHKLGTNLIKVMATGGFLTNGSAPWYAPFTRPPLAGIVGEARRGDKPVAAPAPPNQGLPPAGGAGVTTPQHCPFLAATNT